MPSIESRTSRTGTHWRVVWRQDRKKQTERFASLKAAETFALQVRAAGERWPYGWVSGRGFGPAVTADGVQVVTFEQFARAAIDARSTANPRTRADYLRDLERHVFPHFGPQPVDGIDPQAVGRWVNHLREQRDDNGGRLLADKTVKNVQGLASSVMDDAIKAGHVTYNPFKGALKQLPSSKHEEMCFLTRPEFTLLLSCLAADHYRPLTRTLALTGLRWSEATALPVEHVNLATRRLSVVQAWKRTPEGFFDLGEPKSRRSRRTISIPPSLATDLDPLITGRKPGEFVFTTREGHPVRHGNYYNRVWRPAVRRAQERGLGKQPRIHDLRHSHASWLIADGHSLAAIQRRLGHESITTTIDRYGHLEDAYDDAIALALDDLDR